MPTEQAAAKSKRKEKTGGIHKLKARQCIYGVAGKPVTLCDGGNLYFERSDTGAAFWSFRYRSPVTGKARYLGLGSAHTVDLDTARETALRWKKVLKGDPPRDPQDVDRAAKAAKQEAEEAKARTFQAVAADWIKAHKAGWSSEKHSWQVGQTLERHAYPVIGKLLVNQITTSDVLKVLKPIWIKLPETAARTRGRIEAVLDFAKAQGWRAGDNPAALKGNLDHLLPARHKVAAVEHHAALPWREVPAFMNTLTDTRGVAAMALRYLILTAARTNEIIGATWAEIDLDNAVWTVPASRMKMKREHKVPLSDQAIAILEMVKPLKRKDDGPVFPAPSVGHLSNMSMSAVLKRLKRSDITCHGFRSSFRDWCADETTFQREVCEAALAHLVGNAVEAAYRRTDLFNKRRELMAQWAKYCAG